MRKIAHWKDLQVGKVYNMIYVGSHRELWAHRSITFRVTEVRRFSFYFDVLYARLGSCFTEEMLLQGDSVLLPDKSLKDFELYEVEDESEHFVRALRFNSLGPLIQYGIIAMKALRGKVFTDDDYMRMASCDHSGIAKFVGYVRSFRAKQTSMHPQLKRVCVVWPTFEAMRDDHQAFGAKISKPDERSPMKKSSDDFKELHSSKPILKGRR
jgi:hypothetical protein